MVCLAGCAVIFAAARGDLWLDEIWSIVFAREAKRPIDVVLLPHLRHDNNHVLNTLYLHVVGNQTDVYVYRLLAIVSGAASLWLVALLGKQWGSLESLLSVLLTGAAYPLVLYFSEARGYAPAILFGLLAHYLMEENRRDFKLFRVPFFWTVAILGALSHLTFLIVITALLLMGLVQVLRSDDAPIRGISRLLLHFLPPLIFFVGLYLGFVQDMVTGGGPIYSYWTVFEQVAALVLGFPQSASLHVIAGVCLAALLMLAIFTNYRSSDENWLFYPLILIVTPILMLLITRPEYLYARYFLVCFPFFYLLLGRFLGLWWRSGFAYRRRSVVALLVLLLVGHIHGVYRLLLFGRGNYSAALARIAESSPPGAVRIGSDHDLRNRTIIEFLAPANSETTRLRYVDKEDWHREIPDWLVTHGQDLSFRPPLEITVDGVGIYRFVEVYEFAGVSGWRWFLYLRETAVR